MNTLDSVIVAVILTITALVSAGITHDITGHNMRKQAVEHQCARYNPITAVFEWVEK